MKRAASLDKEQASKRMAIAHHDRRDDSLEDDIEALKYFASLKASARFVSLEELQEVYSILRKWNVLDTYKNQLVGLMPEAYCLLKIISQRDQREESLTTRLPFIFVSAPFY